MFQKLRSLLSFIWEESGKKNPIVDPSPKKEGLEDNEPHGDGDVNEPGNLNN